MRRKVNLSRLSFKRRRIKARLGIKHSVKPSRGPESTRSFSGSDALRTEKPLVLTTTGRASPAVNTTVSPYRKEANILAGSVSTRLSLICRMVWHSVSAEARGRSEQTIGRTTLWLIAMLLTMPSKKNTAQSSPACPTARRVTNVLSP